MKTISSGDSPSKLNILINSLKEPLILNSCNFVFDEMTKKCKNLTKSEDATKVLLAF